MLKSMLLKTFVLSFFCAIPMAGVYGMEEEKETEYPKRLPTRFEQSTLEEDEGLEVPTEVLTLIARNLPPGNLFNASLICKKFKSAMDPIYDELNPVYFTIQNETNMRLLLQLSYSQHLSFSSEYESMDTRSIGVASAELLPLGQSVLKKSNFSMGYVKLFDDKTEKGECISIQWGEDRYILEHNSHYKGSRLYNTLKFIGDLNSLRLEDMEKPKKEEQK